MIICLGTTPAAQRVMVFTKLTLDAVNRAARTLDGPAGKAINVAKVLKVLGQAPLAIGFLGGDRGEFIQSALAQEGIESEFVAVSARTRECVTVIDQSAGTHTELVEESRPVQPADYEKLTAILRRRIAGSSALVMSGTITPGGPVDFYYQCARIGHEAGALTVADAQGTPLLEALKARPALVKPNRAELAATLGQTLADDAALKSCMRDLFERGAQRVVVTAGKEPVWAYDGRAFRKIIPPRIRAVNPIGSGDASTAALAWRLTRGDDLAEACRWGCAAGAANALTDMAGEVDPAAVTRLAREVEIATDR